MPPVISLVGKSHSGKTTLLEQLITELKGRGYRVIAMKHAEDIELDKEGKDSWRFSRAGSEAVVISSPEKMAIIRNTDRDLSLWELAEMVPGDYDVILAEGFKQSSALKIEVHRKEQGNDLLSPPGQLLAVVTDEPLDISVPQFSKDDIKALADMIEKNIKGQSKEEDVSLRRNA